MTMQKFVTQVLTANDLVDGSVVFLRADGVWSRWIAEAAVADGEAASEHLLQAAHGAVADNEVVEPYLIEVVQQDGAPRASHIREHLRTLGPSVLGQLAKSARIAPSEQSAGPCVAA